MLGLLDMLSTLVTLPFEVIWKDATPLDCVGIFQSFRDGPRNSKCGLSFFGDYPLNLLYREIHWSSTNPRD